MDRRNWILVEGVREYPPDVTNPSQIPQSNHQFAQGSSRLTNSCIVFLLLDVFFFSAVFFTCPSYPLVSSPLLSPRQVSQGVKSFWKWLRSHKASCQTGEKQSTTETGESSITDQRRKEMKRKEKRKREEKGRKENRKGKKQDK